MARGSDHVSDTSPLGSPHIDHQARAGWLLRTSRLHRSTGSRLLSDLADEVGVSPGTLSRWETGRVQLTEPVLERLETVLPMPAGSLRGPVALLRRYFALPADRRTTSPPGPADLDGTSTRVRAVFEGGARGIDWMHLADAVDEGALLAPVTVLEPAFDRLISEHARSVGTAYFCREDALVRLVRGPYGAHLQQLLLTTGLAADTQTRVDTLGTAAHHPTPELFATACELLLDERDQVFRGAAWCIETMLRQRVLTVPPLLPRLQAALVALPQDRRATGFELLASLPPGIRQALRPALGPPTPPRGLAALAVRDQRGVAREVARAVARELAASPDPMLERLVRDALFDPFWSKRLSARLLLMAAPYASVVGDGIVLAVRGVADVEDDPLDAGALDFVTSVDSPEGLAIASGWARDPRGPVRERGLVALAHFGHDLDPVLLTDALAAGRTTTERALYAAGMTGSPLLAAWSAAPDPEVARGAAWWLRHGPRVTD